MSLGSIIRCLSHYKIESKEVKKGIETIISIEVPDRNNFSVMPMLCFKNQIIEHIIFDECNYINSLPSFIIKFTLKNEQIVEFILNKQKKLQYDMQNSSIKQGYEDVKYIRDGLITIIDGFFSICESLQTEYNNYIENPYNWVCQNLPKKKNSLSACLGVKKENSFIKMSCLDDYEMFMNGRTTANFIEKTFIVFKDSEKLTILEGCNGHPKRFKGKACLLDKKKTFKETLVEVYSEGYFDSRQPDNRINEDVRPEESKENILTNQNNVVEVHGSEDLNGNIFREAEISLSSFK